MGFLDYLYEELHISHDMEIAFYERSEYNVFQ